MPLVAALSTRLQRFVLVGGLGFAIQLAVLAFLLVVAHWSWPAATIVAVECAIVHNFVWHERWTWADRNTPSQEPRTHDSTEKSTLFSCLRVFVVASPARERLRRFSRFNVATGLTSIVGNVVVMAILVGGLRVPAIPANVIAVGVMSAANYLLADRWVFRGPILRRQAAAVLAIVATASHAWAAPTADTLAEWAKYVTTTERTLRERAPGPVAPTMGIRADGEAIDVGSGTISHWRGSVFLPGLTVERLLHGLQHPGTPPPQEDVVSSRVISRGPDCLRVYIRLVRHAIVTVSYDTEHEMTFARLTPALATARSVATRIDEVGGGDHGFLWRLNSYWRYEQVGTGVLVSLDSVTLSRDVPMLIKPIAGRLVPRIARESMVRTLEALRRQFAA